MKTYTITIFRALDGWRWRMTAPNGRVMADGGEAYVRRQSARKAAERLVEVIRADGGCRVRITEVAQ